MSSIEDLFKALSGEDDLGLVIRSHIVIEQKLHEFIKLFVFDVDIYEKIKLDFYQTIFLALSLGLAPRFSKPLRSLGTLRNDFAHNLRNEISKQDANNLYKAFHGEDRQVLYASLEKTRRNLPDVKVADYKNLSPRDQFSYNVVVINAAIEAAIFQRNEQLS